MTISHYSILILVNSPQERSLYCRYLNQDILATYNVVECGTGLEAQIHLAQNQPDLILLDNQLPDVDGLEFLQQLQSTSLQIPVIMLTAPGDETFAVQALNIGASDYLEKTQFTSTRLCHTIHSTLEKNCLKQQVSNQKRLEYEYQEVLKALQASEAELRGLFNAIVDVVLVIDKQGRYLKIATTGADKLYRPAQEMIGKTAHEVLPHHLADKFVSIIEQTLATQQPSEYEYSLQIGNKDVWFSARISPISPETVIWVARDITEAKHNAIIQKNADQALQENQIFLQVVMDSLPIAIFWKDRNSCYLGCNRQLLLDAGLSSATEIIGKTDFDLPWREQATLYRADDRFVMESGQPKFNIEEPFTKTGNIHRWLHTNKIPLHNAHGEIIGVVASYEDMTERKLIEQALQESERRYATLAASVPVGIFRTDLEGNCLYVNDRWCQIAGLTPEEAVGLGWMRSLHPEDQEMIAAEWDRCTQIGENFSLEYRFLRPDGVETWVFGQAVPEKNLDGQVTGYVGTITDISNRKQTEEALRRSEQLYRTLVDNFPNGAVVLFDHDLRYLLVGGLGLARGGLNKAEMQGKTIWEIFPPEVCEMTVPLLQQALAGESVVAEISYSNHLYVCHHIPVRDEQGNVIAGILMTQDITERKQTENALRNSEEKFRQFAENSRQVMLLRQVDSGELLYVNPSYQHIWGQTSESLYANPDSWMNYMHCDDYERINSGYPAAEGEGGLNEEYRIVRPDGSIRWIWGRCFPIRDSSGNIYRIGAIAEDITDRKETEQERDRLLEILEAQNQTLEAQVAQRTAELRAIIDAIPDYVFVIDRQDMRILYCNNTFAQGVCQQPREQIEGKTIFAALPKQNAENCHRQNQIVFGSGEILRIQDSYNVSGNIFTFDTIKVPLKQANGEMYAIVGTSRDITAIKELELALNESKERFRNLVETSSDWVWEVNEFGVFTYASPQVFNVLGYSPAEILGKTPFDFMPPEAAERVLKEFMKFLSIHAPFQCLENINRHKDGRLITLETSAVPIFDADQQFRGYRGMDRDITIRKQSEAALRQNEIRFQRITANVPGAMYQYVLHADGSQEFPYFSDRCREIFEIEPTLAIQDANVLFQLIHPEDLPSLQESTMHSATSLQQWSWEGKFITPSGRIKWMQGISQPEQQANGDILWDGLILDITERKQSEAKLQAAKIQLRHLSDRLKLAVKSAKIGIWDLDLVNDCLIWDERMYQIFGVCPKSFDLTQEAWKKWEQMVHPDDRVTVNKMIQQVIAENKELDTEFRIIWPDGTIRILKAYGLVQHDSQGQPLRMIGVNYDISDRKLAEAQLQETNKQLIASNHKLARATRLKDEFLATMSHELRTPLNAILGLSEALQDEVFGVINEKQRRSLQTIERSGKHLLELINDILDLSKIEAGQMELDYVPISISSLCQSSLAFIKQQALQKCIQLEVKIQPQLPNFILDERRIRQVLINLLNNAVKFTPEGGRITLEVRREQARAEMDMTSMGDFIRIAVMDTGIGIAPENLHKLFEPFIQVDSSLNRKYEGTGLGLALVKRIVEIHGGRVGVSSELGVGSCFTIDLPCSNISESSAGSMNQVLPEWNCHTQETIEYSPLILLAEDNEANIFTISSYLEAIGFRIILAKNGLEAINLTKMQVPDLILMDIQMPQVNGLEAIEHIMRDTNLAHIPIIALTALAMPGDQEKCLQAGAKDYISKPVKLKQLATMIQQFLAAKN